MEELEGDRVGLGRAAREVSPPQARELSLLVHLRMTGSFGFAPMSHERAVLELDDGSRLAYRDVRRFGTWLVLEDAQLGPYLAAKNGPEPSAHGSPQAGSQRLASPRAAEGGAPRSARRRRSREHLCRRSALAQPIESAPTCERRESSRSSQAAPVDPRCAASRHRPPRIDFPTTERRRGMREGCRTSSVYGRDGEPCSRCGTTISKTRVGGRGTWFCPRCQPLSVPEAGE